MNPSIVNRSLTRLLLAGSIIFCLVAPVGAGEIHLSAAASLREAVGELANIYARQHPGVTFVNNFGASGALAKQIENGAPADLFFSANLEWMDYLKSRGLVDGGSVSPFAYNTLVFVGREGIKAGSLSEVAKLERIAIGSPKSVPAGTYAQEALRNAGIAGQMEKKLVIARDVRECLLYAERGEVDGAFVYRTDALQAGRSTKILFTVPQEFYPRVTCPMALTASGVEKGEAAAFFGFLKSAEAKNVLVKRGFVVE
ncbi:MAG: molybdate ABC transporter substrate-binding protein [Syntrophales bacterium]|nr:molybdate ABC transporter substrate-binding protein [Syntrophales bacterium]